MLRNRNQDFAGYRQEYPPMPMQPPIYTPPRDQLDPKDERLLELSQEVGKLYGVNDLLQEDNVRLEGEAKELHGKNIQLEKRNRELEENLAINTGAREVAQAVTLELRDSKVKKGSE